MVPDSIDYERISFVPAHANADRQIGDEWLEHAETAMMRVPSVLVPYEFNFLLNPLHPDFRAITIESEEPFAFDTRLLPRFQTLNAGPLLRVFVLGLQFCNQFDQLPILDHEATCVSRSVC